MRPTRPFSLLLILATILGSLACGNARSLADTPGLEALESLVKGHGNVSRYRTIQGGALVDHGTLQVVLESDCDRMLEALAAHEFRGSVGDLALFDRDLGASGARSIAELKSVSSFQAVSWKDEWTSHLCKLPLRRLRLQNTKATGATIKEIAQIKTLEYLMLDGSDIDGKSLAPLRDLKKLKQLSIDGESIDDKAISFVADLPQIAVLLLSNTNISDESIATLSRCQKLELLAIGKTKISKEGRNELISKLPDCLILGGE
jgi:hypothetical protein